ncbi:MAG: hypothetical protein IPJ30_28100 [Acidobacteria bacterium]|nr:hypothetical protein [Acidobacteriota bacterium]
MPRPRPINSNTRPKLNAKQRRARDRKYKNEIYRRRAQSRHLAELFERTLGQTPTPNVVYVYDDPAVPYSKYKLTKVSSSVSETQYLACDAAGRVLSSKQLTDGAPPNPTLYSYNLSGAIIEETYPSGRVVRNTLDADGDLMQVQSSKPNQTLRNYCQRLHLHGRGGRERDASRERQMGIDRVQLKASADKDRPRRIGIGPKPSQT